MFTLTTLFQPAKWLLPLRCGLAGRRAGSYLHSALVTRLWVRWGSSEHCLPPATREAVKPPAACPRGRGPLLPPGWRDGVQRRAGVGVRFFTCSSQTCHSASFPLFRTRSRVPSVQVSVWPFCWCSGILYSALFVQQSSWQ